MTSDESKTSGYKDLLVWQKGIALVKQIYQITQSFPAEEKFGLVSQMRRAAVSILSNILPKDKHAIPQVSLYNSFLMQKVPSQSWRLNSSLQLNCATATEQI